jgi:hypothetical protein
MNYARHTAIFLYDEPSIVVVQYNELGQSITLSISSYGTKTCI